MGFRCGIVGLPNVGKSTLFNAMTAARAAAENYPFCTIEPNIGMVPLNDERLSILASIFKPQKVTPTAVEFVDVAGLVEGASKGEGLGNQFLGHIRSVDAIAHVVRCFEDPDVVHVHGKIDPARDIEVIHTELALADLDSISKKIQKVEKTAKGGDKESQLTLEVCQKVLAALNEGRPARGVSLTDDERLRLKDSFLLTMKPTLYVANVAEKDLAGETEPVKKVREQAAREGAEVVVVSGKVEAEIAELAADERATFLKELGLEESGLDRLGRAGYRLLGLITFFTAGEKEVRAWTIPQNTRAPQAAGTIHSDFERGFIRAESYRYQDLIELGSEAKVREAGRYRSEGKEYVVQDGDIFFFRFNV